MDPSPDGDTTGGSSDPSDRAGAGAGAGTVEDGAGYRPGSQTRPRTSSWGTAAVAALSNDEDPGEPSTVAGAGAGVGASGDGMGVDASPTGAGATPLLREVDGAGASAASAAVTMASEAAKGISEEAAKAKKHDKGCESCDVFASLVPELETDGALMQELSELQEQVEADTLSRLEAAERQVALLQAEIRRKDQKMARYIALRKAHLSKVEAAHAEQVEQLQHKVSLLFQRQTALSLSLTEARDTIAAQQDAMAAAGRAVVAAEASKANLADAQNINASGEGAVVAAPAPPTSGASSLAARLARLRGEESPQARSPAPSPHAPAGSGPSSGASVVASGGVDRVRHQILDGQDVIQNAIEWAEKLGNGADARVAKDVLRPILFWYLSLREAIGKEVK